MRERTQRVTVSMPGELADDLRRLADAGAIESVSAYVSEAARARLDRDRHLAELDARLRRRWSEDEMAAGLTWARRTLGVDDGGEDRQAGAA